MQRQPRPANLRLEALLDERDHLKIQLSLLSDSSSPDEAELEETRRALIDLEHQISAYKPPA